MGQLLDELAYACHLYGTVTDYDSSYVQFVTATQGAPDLSRPEHRKALLVWLNQWGCRQFRPGQYEQASEELASWYAAHQRLLPADDRDLWELTESEMTAMGTAYVWLKGCVASHRSRGGQLHAISVGPTGASKVLFAIRPRIAPPWDTPVRQTLGYDGSPASYVSYLKHIGGIIEELGIQCREKGLELAVLPGLLGRPHATVPKLVDEYYWITLSRRQTMPEDTTSRTRADRVLG